MELRTNRVRNSGTIGARIANEGDWKLSLVPFVDYAVGENKSSVLVLSVAVGLVLLIACANLAGLLVSRTLSRTRELAVRAAIGARRMRILSQILSESLLLSVAGGAIGCSLAVGLVSMLLKLAPATASVGLAGGLDIRRVLFCALAALTSAVLFLLAPPFSGFTRGNAFEIVGRVRPQGQPAPQGARREITPGYMEALSIPLRRGRYFDGQDREGSELVALIDETLEKQFWPAEKAVGQRIQLGRREFTIVGVVGRVVDDNLAADWGRGVFT
jgi:hypothetical protein